MNRNKFRDWNRRLETKVRSVKPAPYSYSDGERSFNKQKLRRILDGEVRLLLEVFLWGDTPQGSHWEHFLMGYEPLSSRDKEYIQALIDGNVEFREITDEDRSYWNE